MATANEADVKKGNTSYVKTRDGGGESKKSAGRKRRLGGEEKGENKR